MAEEGHLAILEYQPTKMDTTTIRLARKLKTRALKYKEDTGVDMTSQISDALNKFLTERGY